MNHSNNIHRLFDGELSEEESRILKEAIAADPSLADELSSIGTLAELHRETIPEPKDAFFIGREFNEIQKQIQSKSEATHITESKPDSSKVVFFPGSNWLRGVVAFAAAVLLTVTGAWIWNRNATNASLMDASSIAFVETDITGASSMIFIDEQSGWTFVWVDEPPSPAETAG